MPASLIDGTPIEPLVTCKLLGVHWWSGEHELQTLVFNFIFVVMHALETRNAGSCALICLCC